MPTKKAKRSTKSVKNLKAKSLTGKVAKSVKGGFIRLKRTGDDGPEEIRRRSF